MDSSSSPAMKFLKAKHPDIHQKVKESIKDIKDSLKKMESNNSSASFKERTIIEKIDKMANLFNKIENRLIRKAFSNTVRNPKSFKFLKPYFN